MLLKCLCPLYRGNRAGEAGETVSETSAHDTGHAAEQPHAHGAGHGHSHTHGAGSSLARLRIVFALTTLVLLAELAGSYLSGSLTLLADAGHMFVDCAGLLIALIAARLMNRPRTDKHTWGLARVEVVSAAIQASMLLVVCVAVAIEAVRRLLAPVTVTAPEMAVFALVGLVANLVGLLLLRGHAEQSLNMRAAFLEVLNDAIGSLAVLLAALVIALTGQVIADPIASLLVAALMAPRALRILGRSLEILLESTPEGLDLEKMREHILRQERVIDVHDLHVSNISSNNVNFTAHVTVEPDCFRDGGAVQLVHDIQECVGQHFPVPVGHCTIQLDSPEHRDHESLTH